jgi:hypothetical protein
VILKRFFAPEWVFIFGMRRTSVAKRFRVAFYDAGGR